MGKRTILNMYITDLINLRIAIDANSKVERINKKSKKLSKTYTYPKNTPKKVLKDQRHN